MSTRAALIAQVEAELAAARSAARAALARAHAQGQAARSALEAARSAEARTVPALDARRSAALAELHRRMDRQRDTAAGQLAGLMAEYAPGAAGEPWPDWQPTPPGRGWQPGLVRIGELAGHRLPALVPLLDAAHVTVTGGSAARADGLIAGLLLRAIGSAPPGAVVLRVYDPERLGGSLAGLAPLAGAGLLHSTGPGSLPELLDELVHEIRRVNEYVLAGELDSLAALAEATGRRPEPWRIAVLLGAEELRPEAAAQLDRIVRTGIACGVHVVARGRSLPGAVTIRLPANENTTRTNENTARTSLTGAVPVNLDEPPPAGLVNAVCRRLAAGPPPAVSTDLLPEKLRALSAAEELTAPVGEGPDGRLAELPLGDNPPHALIGGASGSGKTNLIYAWLAGLTSRYSPDEVELYRKLVQSLAATQAQRTAESRTVEKSYVDGCADAAKAVTDAAAAVASAASEARAAATLVTDADADAATLWRELGRQLGRRWAVRLGPLPAPAVETGETDPAVPLTRAADLIAAAEQATPHRVPLPAYPVLAVIGAGCAAAVALPAMGLLAAFGGVLVVTVPAQLMIFLAPFVGLPVAHRWIRDRWHTRMAFLSFALTAMSGVLTCCAIAIFVG